jgi:hypothetical protein
MKKKKFDRNVVGLLSNTALHQIIAIYMGTFLVAHILNISAGNFHGVALYYVISYATMIVFYSLFSYIATKLNKTILTRIAVILYAPILVTIAALGSSIVNYIPLIAFLYNSGFSFAIFFIFSRSSLCIFKPNIVVSISSTICLIVYFIITPLVFRLE